MNLKKNAIANYVGQFYNTIIGIVILPIYLHFMGASAFGLIGLFTMMQVWFKMLDLGLTPTLARQVAVTAAHQTNFPELLKLVRSLEVIFLFISLTIALIVGIGAHWISHEWLKVDGLSYHTVTSCIILMGIMLGIKWFSELYISGIRGLEQQVWLNGLNIVMATLQYVGVLALLKWVSTNPVVFFEYQLGVLMLSLLLAKFKFYGIFPKGCRVGLSISWSTLKKVLPFSSGMAYSMVIWILLTQLGRLLLSNILPLSEYGYFSLVTTLAAGLMQLYIPIAQAVLPRMTHLWAKRDEQNMMLLYRKATQWMCVIMFSAAAMVGLFAHPLLFAWTNNQALAVWGAPILFWYAMGYALFPLLTLQSYLQIAHGTLRLSVITSSVIGIFMLPLMWIGAYHFGVYGVMLTWCGFVLVCFLIQPWLTHRVFVPGFHLSWLAQDILPIFISTLIMSLLLFKIHFSLEHLNRGYIFLVLFLLGIVMLFINAMVSQYCRQVMLKPIRRVL